MRHLMMLLAVAGAALGSNAFAACFTVTDRANAVIYRGESSPIDLSKPISEGIAERFPGGHLVMSLYSCSGSGPASSSENLSMTTSGNPGYEARLGRYSVAGSLGGSGYRGSGSDSSPGTDVQVRSYTRSDGTVVRGHTRGK